MKAPELPPEPPNGSMVVVYQRDNTYQLIWRDDAEAQNDWKPNPPCGQHWYDDPDDIPMSWTNINKYAVAMWMVDRLPFWGQP